MTIDQSTDTTNDSAVTSTSPLEPLSWAPALPGAAGDPSLAHQLDAASEFIAEPQAVGADVNECYRRHTPNGGRAWHDLTPRVPCAMRSSHSRESVSALTKR